MKTNLEILTEGRALLSDPRRFAQGSFARDKNGESCGFRSLEACAYCSFGALWSREHGSAVVVGDILRRAAVRVLEERNITRNYDDKSPVVYVNDNLGYEATLKMWAYAIEEASGQKSECAA